MYANRSFTYTFRSVSTGKPHIQYISAGVWVCISKQVDTGAFIKGYGISPTTAYDSWVMKLRLEGLTV